MADNTTLPAGAGGDTVRDKDRAGVKTQIVALDLDPAGSETLMGGTLPTSDAAAQTKLDSLLTELGQKLEAGGEVALAAATLAALETIQVGTSGLPTGASTAAKQDTLIAKDFATQTTLASLLTELGQKLEPGGEIALDAASLAALETIQVGSSALPTGASTAAKQDTMIGHLDGVEAALAALEEVGLDAATLAALETITIGSSALPTGASTSAKQDTAQTALDAIKTALEILDNAIAGSEIQADVLTQPARVATTDTITAKIATDKIQDGVTALTPKFGVIDAAGSGDNTLLAAVSSKKIRVLSAFLVAAGTVNTRFESGAGGTALSGQMNLVANTGFVLPFNPVGWFETAATTLLNLELSAAISVDGSFTYVEV